MTLLVDCQLFQGMTWHRGMGKYSLELLSHISSSHSDIDIHLIFNKNATIPKEVGQVLNDRLTSFTIHSLDFEIVDGVHGWESAAAYNQNILDNFINDNKLIRSTYLILSLFEGEWVSCFPTLNNIKKTLLFYDLIPYLFHGHYFQNPVVMDFMLRKYKVIFKADRVLTISRTTAQDVVEYLGIPNRKVISIDGARITRDKLHPKKPMCIDDDKYILMSTGDDYRKNNIRAVKAFEKFSKTNPGYKLVITSFFQSRSINSIKRHSKNIIFSGNVSEEELLWLYQNTEIVFFPTLYEGLGLPILEAIESHKRVACSDIPVFREISRRAFTLFDPYNIDSIANGLEDSINSKLELNEYTSIESYYNWDSTVNKFMESLSFVKSDQKARKKIAILGPSPSSYSGIAKVIEKLHGHMLDDFDIDYYLESSSYNKRPNYLQYVAKTYDIEDYNGPDKYEKVIYHIGNSENHMITLKHCLRFPDTIVLHDLNLQGLYSIATTKGFLSSKRYVLEERLSELTGTEYNASIIKNQNFVIVHSEFAKNKVSKLAKLLNSKTKIIKANLPIPVYDGRLNISKTIEFNEIFGIGGMISESKGLDLIQEIFKEQDLINMKAVVFGYIFNSDKRLISYLKKQNRISLKGDLTDFEYENSINEIDILIAYRDIYNGETSYTVLEALRLGKKTIVKDIGWFSELPDEIVAKTMNSRDVIITLKNYANELKQEKVGLIQLQQSLKYIKHNHNEEEYIKKLV